MLKKPADELVVRLANLHQEVENVIQDYMNEYADYGWDSTCEELRNIGASVDAVMTILKYAATKEQFGIGGKYRM